MKPIVFRRTTDDRQALACDKRALSGADRDLALTKVQLHLCSHAPARGPCLSRRLVFMVVAILALSAGLTNAASLLNYIESKRCTPVVYVGLVSEVKTIGQAEYAIKEQARIDVKVVGRGGGGTPPRVASFPFDSYDGTSPVLAGGEMYYLLKPGMWVLVFSEQFDNAKPPSYLYYGTREEMTKQIQTFADKAAAMRREQLAFNMISAAQRDEQLVLYRHLLEQLSALP